MCVIVYLFSFTGDDVFPSGQTLGCRTKIHFSLFLFLSCDAESFKLGASHSNSWEFSSLTFSSKYVLPYFIYKLYTYFLSISFGHCPHWTWPIWGRGGLTTKEKRELRGDGNVLLPDVVGAHGMGLSSLQIVYRQRVNVTVISDIPINLTLENKLHVWESLLGYLNNCS